MNPFIAIFKCIYWSNVRMLLTLYMYEVILSNTIISNVIIIERSPAQWNQTVWVAFGNNSSANLKKILWLNLITITHFSYIVNIDR